MIPYNPSSFNSNKTILEQILELKKWLKEHPSYAVYTTYIHYKPAENVDYFFTEINGDPDFVDNIAVGDLLWFGDGYISPIASITIDPNDRENSYVTISQPVTSLIGPTGPQGPRGYDGVSVTNASVNASGYLIITLSNGLTVNTGYVVGPQGTTGPEGPEGPQGPTGPTGVSITNVAIDGNSHLIVTLSNGSTIDAGSVSSGGMEVVELTSNTGTLSVDDFNKVNSYNCVIVRNNNIYVRERSSVYNTIKYCCSFADGSILKQTLVYTINLSTRAYTHATNIDTITEDSITSNIATNGQVLTADGNGNCSWQTPSGGSFDHYVILYSSSGTLTQDEFNKLTYEDSIIIFSPGSSSYYEYGTREENSSYYYFKNVTGDSGVIKFQVDKNTRAYSRVFLGIKSSAIKSQTAINGQVLTADGNGNCSWQTPSGSSKYQHNIRLFQSASYDFVISIINSDSTPYSTATECINAIANYMANATQNGTSTTKMFLVNGLVGSASINNLITRCTYSNGTIEVHTNTANYTVSPSDTIASWSDSVVAL